MPATPATPRRAGPAWPGVYGSKLQLTNGSQVLVNDAYLRDAILNPSQHVTAGYAPIMPTYQGQISEDGLIDLVEYLKNLQFQLSCAADVDHIAVRPGGASGVRGGETMSAPSQHDSQAARPEHAQLPKKNFINAEHGLLSWLLTGDHKRIAMLYLISITFFFFIGGAFAGLIRLELLTPQPDLVASDTYNKLFTMHGVIMIFLFLVPSVPATLGNFLIPIMIGARDLAFPKINLLSWYLYVAGGTLMLTAHGAGRRRHRLDLHHAALHPLSQHPRHHHGDGGLHRRLQLHLYRAELYRDHPPHALPGNDLVPHAAVRVVALRGLHPDGAGHAGAGHHAGPGRAGAHSSASASSIPPRAAIRCSSSISSGSTRIPPSTS